jgi:hypothetical protein
MYCNVMSFRTYTNNLISFIAVLTAHGTFKDINFIARTYGVTLVGRASSFIT